MVGVLGGLTMLTTFACVKFMPVGDAMTLIFTNPLFTMLFAACFMGHRLSTLKIISSNYLLQLSKLHDIVDQFYKPLTKNIDMNQIFDGSGD